MQPTERQGSTGGPAPEKLRITVVYAPAARQWHSVTLELAAGSTVVQAVRQSRVLDGQGDEALDSLAVGVWGRKAALTRELRDGDRIELCRPLKVDPKLARRQRFASQGAKAAGLFARRREGAKAGY